MIKLINDDCIKAMKELSNEEVIVDLVLTDPPYGTTACKWDSIIPFTDMWDEIHSLTKPTTPILLFGTEPFSSNLRMSNIKEYKYDWIWHKNRSGDFALAKKRPMKYHEVISVFYKKQCYYNPQFQEYYDSVKKRFKEGDVRKGDTCSNIHGDKLIPKHSPISFSRGKYPESVQRFKAVNTANNGRMHPSQKPVELLEYLIKTYTKKDDLVLDFTMGSGSTGVACQNTNRRFIGIELDKEYYDIAVKRLKENTIQRKLI